MEVYVGTSGWMYSWNLGRSLEWYVNHSELNAVELNASFYRVPAAGQVERWAEVGRALRWAVKVYRGVTHFGKLSEKALERLGGFLAVLRPLDRLVDFYLFQMPPTFRRTAENMARVEQIARLLGVRAAFEFRHTDWFRDEVVRWAERVGFTLVSVDSPDGTWIVSTCGVVYLRMHGRTFWYSHHYEEDELRAVAEEVARLRPDKAYIFFNNNHSMLDNARTMLNILKSVSDQVNSEV
ncbi:MAG: DUF72 domain-containing protein [Pyrobaculum sp.]